LINILELTQLDPSLIESLTDLLVAVVGEGASIGFLPPLTREEGRAYWQHVLSPGTVLLVAEGDGRIVGSAQLHLELRANGRHRAEVAKLMVHPDARRRGLARQLMHALEAAACREQRSLLVLDTRDGDPSNALYRSLGYVEVGRVPHYARSANGALDASVFYYKEL
jgi:ribosomal protein S18 acetylase RimI-like enzyme